MPALYLKLDCEQLLPDVLARPSVHHSTVTSPTEGSAPHTVGLATVNASFAKSSAQRSRSRLARAHSGICLGLAAPGSLVRSSIHTRSRSRGMRTDPPILIDGIDPLAARSSTLDRLTDIR